MPELTYKLHSVESVKSTNTAVKELAKEGAPEGYVLTAHEQTNGRGRLNRVFFSPRGTGLYLSILLRPSCLLAPYALTCMTAVALSETIEEFGITCGIKWVNDIYVDGRKIAGILTESHLNQDGSFDYAVVGIGVNLFYPEEGFPDFIAQKAGALFPGISNEDLRKNFLKKLLTKFKFYYDQLPSITFYESYCSRLIGAGKRILVSEPDGMHYGVASGIDRTFRMIVRFDDGTTGTIDRGELEFLE